MPPNRQGDFGLDLFLFYTTGFGNLKGLGGIRKILFCHSLINMDRQDFCICWQRSLTASTVLYRYPKILPILSIHV